MSRPGAKRQCRCSPKKSASQAPRVVAQIFASPHDGPAPRARRASASQAAHATSTGRAPSGAAGAPTNGRRRSALVSWARRKHPVDPEERRERRPHTISAALGPGSPARPFQAVVHLDLQRQRLPKQGRAGGRSPRRPRAWTTKPASSNARCTASACGVEQVDVAEGTRAFRVAAGQLRPLEEHERPLAARADPLEQRQPRSPRRPLPSAPPAAAARGPSSPRARSRRAASGPSPCCSAPSGLERSRMASTDDQRSTGCQRPRGPARLTGRLH